MPTPKRSIFSGLPGTLLCIVILLCTGAWFWSGCLDDYFAQDDFLILEATAPWDWQTSIWTYLLGPGAVDNHFRPLSTILPFGNLQYFFGPDPFYFHLLSVLVHITNSLLVFGIVWSLTISRALGLVAGLLFSSRSLSHVAVFWASGLQELLFGTGALLFVLLALWHLRRPTKWSLTRTLLALIFALGCKENALLLWLLVPVLYLLYRDATGSRRRPFMQLLAGSLLVTLLFFALRFQFTHGAATPYQPSPGPYSIARFAAYLSWFVHGPYEVSLPLAILAPLGILAFTSLPLLLRKTESSPHSWQRHSSPAILLLLVLTAALPTLVLQDRSPAYYAYLPAALLAVCLAQAIFIWQRNFFSSPKTRVPILAACGVLVLLSLASEYSLLKRKDSIAWELIYLPHPDGTKTLVPRPNRSFLFSGGWLNTFTRLRFKNFSDSLTRHDKTLQPILGPSKLKTTSTPSVYIAVFPGDTMVSSRLRSPANKPQLLQVSSLESMLRITYGQPELKLVHIMPPNAPPGQFNTSYYEDIQNAALEMKAHPQSSVLLLCSPWDGTIEKIVPGTNDELENEMYAYFERQSRPNSIVLRTNSGVDLPTN